MTDQLFEMDQTASAFRFASHWWRSLVGAIDEHQWEAPGLGEWSVRELVAHGDRAYKTVLEYVAGDAKDPTVIHSAAEYFRTVLREETPHVHIAARAKREAGEREDWVVGTDELADRVDHLLADLAGDTAVHLFVGEMDVEQYLATRVVELVLHGLDLSAAIDLPTTPPPAASEVAMAVLLDLADGPDVAAILRLLTGRSAELPLSNVLG